jgi:hypothetical protein
MAPATETRSQLRSNTGASRKRKRKATDLGQDIAGSAKLLRTNPFKLRQESPQPHPQKVRQTSFLNEGHFGIKKDEPKAQLNELQSRDPLSSGGDVRKRKKDKRRRKASLIEDGSEKIKQKATKNVEENTPQVSVSAGSTLTPLQQKMRAKLSGSQFRHINEKLYTSHSAEALSLFADQPNLFHDVSFFYLFLTTVPSRLSSSSPIMANESR